jgi:hypothetical protein
MTMATNFCTSTRLPYQMTLNIRGAEQQIGESCRLPHMRYSDLLFNTKIYCLIGTIIIIVAYGIEQPSSPN